MQNREGKSPEAQDEANKLAAKLFENMKKLNTVKTEDEKQMLMEEIEEYSQILEDHYSDGEGEEGEGDIGQSLADLGKLFEEG